MLIITRRLFLAGAGASLVITPFRSIARDLPNNPYRFALLPGATMSISVRFNSGWTNAMSLVDERTGRHFAEWPGCGNRDNRHPKTFEYKNRGTATAPFAVSHGYKRTPQDDPNAPWNENPGVIKSYSPLAITIGYTDTTSPDHTNCLITITLTDGQLPDPR